MSQKAKASRNDVISASAITSLVLSLMNAGVNKLSNDCWIKPFLNDLVLSFLSSIIAIVATSYLVLARQKHYYNVHVKNYESKLKALEMLNSSSTNDSEKQNIENQILKLRAELAKNIVQETPLK